MCIVFFFFFSSRRRHTRSLRDWSSDVCSSDLRGLLLANVAWADSMGGAKWDSARRPIAELGGAVWADHYHVWRMDWDEREIRLYVDSLLLNTTPLDSTFNGAGRPPNPLRQPHHLLLSLAIGGRNGGEDRKSTRLNSSHVEISYAVFCLK